MVCHVPGCLGHYDFDQITAFARKRFVEGVDTVSLMSQAGSQREKEEIALVCMLDIDHDQVRDLRLSCRYGRTCKITDCMERLKRMIAEDLAMQQANSEAAGFAATECQQPQKSAILAVSQTEVGVVTPISASG